MIECGFSIVKCCNKEGNPLSLPGREYRKWDPSQVWLERKEGAGGEEGSFPLTPTSADPPMHHPPLAMHVHPVTPAPMLGPGGPSAIFTSCFTSYSCRTIHLSLMKQTKRISPVFSLAHGTSNTLTDWFREILATETENKDG